MCGRCAVPGTGRRADPTAAAEQGVPDRGLAEPAPHSRGSGPTFPCRAGAQHRRTAGRAVPRLVDIDLDAVEAVAAAPLLLPPTGWVSGREGKPRSHWWYRVRNPPNKAAENYDDTEGEQRRLLELRSTGGQTVVPPGVHESGEAIVWHGFTTPADVELGELLNAVRAVAAVALLARHWPAKGARQDAFLALAGALLRAGWAQGRTERFVQALAVATNDDEPAKRIQAVAATFRKQAQNSHTTGWPKLEELIGPTGKEVVRHVRQWLGMMPKNASGVGANKKVRTLEPYQPFPVEALPAPLDEFVRQGALALGCDPAFLALPVLAVVASVIGNTRVLQLKRTWHEPSVVWAAIVGDSGTLKSPAIRMAVAYLLRLQRHMKLVYQAKMAEYKEKLREYKAAQRRDPENGATPPTPPEAPVLQRVLCSDATIEKLAEILEDNPRGTLLARDELTAWFGSFGRYKGHQGGTDLPAWLEFHRAGSILIDRKTSERRHIFVERAAVYEELAAAYGKLEGYAARFALLQHVVSRAARGADDLVPVGKESVEAGVALCRWFARESRRIYATLAESSEESDTRRLVEFLQSRGAGSPSAA
jgi:hypothetical protein